MQAYFEPEQAFTISTPQPVFKILIACKKEHVQGFYIWKDLLTYVLMIRAVAAWSIRV